MSILQFPFILIAGIALLAVILLLVLFTKKDSKRLTPLAGIAFACIAAGVIYGETRVVGYSLLAAGIVLAVIDAVLKRRK